MTERIKLTAANIHSQGVFDHIELTIRVKDREELESLTKQILDDQEKAEKWNEFVNSRKGTASESFYEQENKQLKADKQLLAGALDLAAKDAHNLKQKLEKIKSLEYNLRNTDDANFRPVLHQLREILKE